MRPLGIGFPRDKIIQQAMLFIIESVLDPKLTDLISLMASDLAEDALRLLDKLGIERGGVAWFIEGDIKGLFDNIDHHKLEYLLKNHFKEARLFHLYWKIVKAGYIEWDYNIIKLVASDVGVPQGSIISPILSNLILHELDKLIESKIIEYNKASWMVKPYLTKPKYHNLTMRITRLIKKVSSLKVYGLDKVDIIKKMNLEYYKFIKLIRLQKSIIPNPLSTTIKYVRYVDDWLLGL